MHAIESMKTQKIEGLVASHQDQEFDLPRAYSREQIPVRCQQISRPKTARKFTHLKSIANEIPPYNEELNVCIQIGNNCVRAIKPRRMIPGKSAEPYAIRAALGWGIISAVTESDSATDGVVNAGCHNIATRELGSDKQQLNQFVLPESYKEVMTPLSVKRMFEQDFSETQTNDKPMSQEDIKFMKITKDSIHITNDGHYGMKLPLREENVDLPCNRKSAEACLTQLKRRFDKSQGRLRFLYGRHAREGICRKIP